MFSSVVVGSAFSLGVSASAAGTADSHALTAHAPGAGAKAAGGGGAGAGTESVESSAGAVGGTYICVNVEKGAGAAAVVAVDAGPPFPLAAPPRRPRAPAKTGSAGAEVAEMAGDESANDDVAVPVVAAAKSPPDGCADEDTIPLMIGGGAFDGSAVRVAGSSSAKTHRPSFSSK